MPADREFCPSCLAASGGAARPSAPSARGTGTGSVEEEPFPEPEPGKSYTFQFGGLRSPLADALRRSFTFPVPRFGTRCVCCDADAKGRLQGYDPSSDRVRAPSIAVPVCTACARHALGNNWGLEGAGLLGGAAMIGLGLYHFDAHGNPLVLLTVGFGLLALVVTVAWLVREASRVEALKQQGHHPRMLFTIEHLATRLHTTNPRLAREVAALNPEARRQS